MFVVRLEGLFSTALSGVIFTGLLTSCAGGSSDKKDGPTPSAISLNAANAACEKKIRAQMLDFSLQFADVPRFAEEIRFANEARAFDGTDFAIRQTNHQTQSLSMESKKRSADQSQDLQYQLSINGDDSASPMTLELEFRRTEKNGASDLSQKFGVSKTCEISLKETDLQVTRPAGDGYDINSQALYYDGGEQKQVNHVSLRPGQRLTNVSPAGDDPRNFHDGDVTYVANLGLLTVRATPAGENQIREFGESFSFAMTQLDLIANEKSFLKIAMGEDKKAGVSYVEFAGQRSWLLPRKLWEIQSLGTSAGLSSFVDLKLPAHYLETHSSFVVLAGAKPGYEHEAAYHNVVPMGIDPATQRDKFIYQEKLLPTVADRATPADLASNDTIQTSYPEIQSVAQRIRAQAPADRRKQIEQILIYLSDNYQYDKEMARNNVIRPLTVAEALERHMGVCQHYAVIFTTLARALGIPARTIIGYLLTPIENGGIPVAGGHAWVEAEVEPGLWQVIEPQMRRGLTETYTRFYMPVAHSKILEDKNYAGTDDASAMINLQLQILPL